MLQSDGIITNQPHHGMTVTSHEPKEIEEVYRLRELVEPLAAEYAARNCTQGDVERLTTLHAEIVKAVRDDRDSIAAELNAQFHAAIIEMSSSRLIADVYSRLRIVLPLEALWLNSRSGLTVREHKKVVAAIAKGDPEAAATAMLAHVARGHRQAAKRFATNVDAPGVDLIRESVRLTRIVHGA